MQSMGSLFPIIHVAYKKRMKTLPLLILTSIFYKILSMKVSAVVLAHRQKPWILFNCRMPIQPNADIVKERTCPIFSYSQPSRS